jgi:hypothetical protein
MGKIILKIFTLKVFNNVEFGSKPRCPVVVYSVSGQPAWEGKADGVSGIDG